MQWIQILSLLLAFSAAVEINLNSRIYDIKEGWDSLSIRGTGAGVWPAARIMSDYLVANPSIVAGRRVVELGCGAGVVALAACLSGAAEVLATDGEPSVVTLARQNLQVSHFLSPRDAELKIAHEAKVNS